VTLGSTELLLIVLIIVVLFGSTLLPKLARGIMQSRREFDRSAD
jgi:Sec-independent protein translocase protein TatA